MLREMNSAIRVLLCDDQMSIRTHLRKVFGNTPRVEVVGEASGGRRGVELALELTPDVVIMDISMPDLNGIEATRQIRDRLPTSRVVIFSSESSAETVDQVFLAGACAYVVKSRNADELVHAVHVVMRGERYISPQIAPEAGERQKPETRSLEANPDREKIEPIRVVLLDDMLYVRDRLAELLSAVEGVTVVGQAPDVPTARQLIEKLQPDVLVMDLDLPGQSGMDLLATIPKEGYRPLVIILTNYDYPVLRAGCAKLGADFYFYKPVDFERVIEVCEDLAKRARNRNRRAPETN